MIGRNHRFWVVWVVWGVSACASTTEVDPSGTGSSIPTVASSDVGFTPMTRDLDDDVSVEALIGPFRDQMEAQLEQVLTQATGEFIKADPEGALDNLVADAVLHESQDLVSGEVDVVLLNDGGLRVPIPAGPIKVRKIFEVLPFENFITILTFSGADLELLADQIARTNGEPVAGWTMVLVGDDAQNVLVDGEAIDPAGTYRLATVDYLANGGGNWSELWEPDARFDTGILIRDVVMEYLRTVDSVSPTLDGRITRSGN